MWEQILSLAVGNGLWAVLFCALLFYLLRESKAREEKYVALITSLNKKLEITETIEKDVKTIKEHTEKLVRSSKLKTKQEQAGLDVKEPPVLSVVK